MLNAEYFFENIGPQFNFPDAHDYNKRVAKEASKRVLELAKKVLVENGRVRLQTHDFFAKEWAELLEESGFVVTSISHVPENKVVSWWGKRYLREAKELGPNWLPTQIIARKKPTGK